MRLWSLRVVLGVVLAGCSDTSARRQFDSVLHEVLGPRRMPAPRSYVPVFSKEEHRLCHRAGSYVEYVNNRGTCDIDSRRSGWAKMDG